MLLCVACKSKKQVQRSSAETVSTTVTKVDQVQVVQTNESTLEKAAGSYASEIEFIFDSSSEQAVFLTPEGLQKQPFRYFIPKKIIYRDTGTWQMEKQVQRKTTDSASAKTEAENQLKHQEKNVVKTIDKNKLPWYVYVIGIAVIILIFWLCTKKKNTEANTRTQS